MANTYEDQLKKIYGDALATQKTQLQADYEAADAKLTAQKEEAQKATDKNINLAKVDAQKAAVSDAEYYAAAGLSSGAKAQARLARENQLMSDLATLRAAQQTADADAERQRGLLAKEYASAITKAQAENDLALAQALYAKAEEEDAKLLAQQENAANLMAQAGDYSRLGALYGLSDAEIKKLRGGSAGRTGGVAGNPIGDPGTPSFSGKANNGSVRLDNIILMQKDLGVETDGKWGPATREAAYAKYGTINPDDAWAKMKNTLVRDTAQKNTAFNTDGATSYSEVLADMQTLKASGRSGDIEKLLDAAASFLTPSEYLRLSNLYQSGML